MWSCIYFGHWCVIFNFDRYRMDYFAFSVWYIWCFRYNRGLPCLFHNNFSFGACRSKVLGICSSCSINAPDQINTIVGFKFSIHFHQKRTFYFCRIVLLLLFRLSILTPFTFHQRSTIFFVIFTTNYNTKIIASFYHC